MTSEQKGNPKLLSVAELASRLGVSKCWIYQHAGELQPIRIGRLIRFSESQILLLQNPSAPSKYATPKEENCLKPERKYGMGFKRYQRGSVYRVGDSWEAYWREDVVTPEGKVNRKQCHRVIGTIREYPTRSAARRQLDRILCDYSAKTEITFAELYERWNKAVVPTLKRATANHYEHVLKKNILPQFGESQISEIGRYQVQLFLASKAANYSTSSLRGMRTTLQKVFSWAIDCGWLKENPCSRIKVPRSARAKRRRYVLSPEQVLALSAKLDRQEAALIIFLPATGLRISEAVALKWSDIEPDGIHVRRRMYEGEIDEVKSDESERVVPLAEHVRKLLSLIWDSQNEWIFHGRTGQPLNHRNLLRRKIKPALLALGLPCIGYHDFRHTLISWLGAAGKNPKMIAEVVGHSDITTTLAVYTHPSMPEKLAALDSVANHLLQDVTDDGDGKMQIVENKKLGEPGRTRTSNPLIKSQLLYH